MLEAELREVDEDINLNTTMARKYGDAFFADGAARLAQTRVCLRDKVWFDCTHNSSVYRQCC